MARTPKKTQPAQRKRPTVSAAAKQAAPRRSRKSGKETLQSVRGMHDILPAEQLYWDKVRKVGRDVADTYGFQQIETPVVEQASLFVRSVGEHTDIVEKEMFYLKTGGNLVLRPEGTAPVARAYIEHSLDRMSQPLKVWYWEPMFRHEQPQAGRYRSFYQWGIEIFGGGPDPIYDAQVILAAYRFLDGARMKDVRIELNSIGCRTCRVPYRKKLVDYYRGVLKGSPKALCENCKKRLTTNPLRLLDCKSEECQPHKEKAPNILNAMDAACKDHFKNVLEYLDELKLPYTLNPYLVRGLDYYNRTVFEVFAGANPLALISGGRYDYLVETIGGKPTPAVGAAAGIERIVGEMKERGIAPQTGRTKNKIFLVYVGDLAKKRSLVLIEEFRTEGIKIHESFGKDSLSAQLKAADRENARIALILGQKEVYEESIIVRDMRTGAQETTALPRVVQLIKKRLQDIV